MTTTDLASFDDDNLELEMKYSELISKSDLLPQAYRGRPANVLIAVGLGKAMGLSRAESLYRIDVIQGKPTASAELIAANVRKAGHKLRTVVNDQEMWAETVITRADDPDAPPQPVRRDMAWAQRMGLAGKDNYKKQPLTMLTWRSITAAARLMCPEALYGVQYTADELMESGAGRVDADQAATRATAATFAPAQAAPDTGGGEATLTHDQRMALKEMFDDAGIPREHQAAYIRDQLGDRDANRKLTVVEADQVIDALRRDLTSETVDAEVVEEDPPTDGTTLWEQEDAEAAGQS